MSSGTLKVRRTVYRETGGSLTVGDTKTSAGTRKIVLSSSTAEILSKRKASALTEWIFPNQLKAAAADSAYDFPLAHRVLEDMGIDFFVAWRNGIGPQEAFFSKFSTVSLWLLLSLPIRTSPHFRWLNWLLF